MSFGDRDWTASHFGIVIFIIFSVTSFVFKDETSHGLFIFGSIIGGLLIMLNIVEHL